MKRKDKNAKQSWLDAYSSRVCKYYTGISQSWVSHSRYPKPKLSEITSPSPRYSDARSPEFNSRHLQGPQLTMQCRV